MEEDKDLLSNFKRTEKPNLASDYFDSFQKKMLDEVKPEEKNKNENPIEFNVRYLYYVVGVAAAVAIVFFFINTFNGSPEAPINTNIASEETIEEVDQTDEYYEYIEENLTEYSTQDIIDLLAENGVLTEDYEVDLTTITPSEVEIYLLEEYDDLEEELLEEL